MVNFHLERSQRLKENRCKLINLLVVKAVIPLEVIGLQRSLKHLALLEVVSDQDPSNISLHSSIKVDINFLSLSLRSRLKVDQDLSNLSLRSSLWVNKDTFYFKLID